MLERIYLDETQQVDLECVSPDVRARIEELRELFSGVECIDVEYTAGEAEALY